MTIVKLQEPSNKKDFFIDCKLCNLVSIYCKLLHI